MEEQKAKNWTAIVIAIAVTAVLAIFGTWYFTSGTKADESIPTNFIKNVTELNVGDKVAGWTVEKTQPYSDTMEDTSFLDEEGKKLANLNAQIDFTGDVEITGDYDYGYDQFLLASYNLIFTITDSSEIAKMPYILDQYHFVEDINTINLKQPEQYSFYLDKEKYAKMFGFTADENEHHGTATIKLSNFQLNSYPSSVYNEGTISEVVNVAK